MRLRRRGARGARVASGACLAALVVALVSSGSAWGAPSASTPGSSVPTVHGGVKGQPGYLVYWDQNEEVDFLSMPTGTLGQLLPAWDLNGQVCVLPDGRFVGGYDPTLPSQHNLGGLKPYKQPADGEELDEPNGSFSGQTLYVPGPYKIRGQSIGSDSPPSANGVFNNNQTYTGCAIDSHQNIFANDIATAQGSYPPPSSGRLVEWFAPNYTTDVHRVRPHRRWVTGRTTRTAPAGWPSRGPWRVALQRRPADPQRRHLERAPLRPRVPPDQRRPVPGRGVPARQGAGVDLLQGRLPRRHRTRTRRAAATPSAATSATPPSSG